MNTVFDSRRQKGLILASGSPRRAALLDLVGIPFETMLSDVQEDLGSLDPAEHVLQMSRKKALAVARKLKQGLVLGADTIVAINGQVLGKPRHPEEAACMLRQLAGRTHKVFTGLTLIDVSQDHSLSDFVVTLVKMRSFSQEEIDWYVATGEPMDKAGAYGIQSKGAVLIERIEGCFYNVVGLPLAKLVQMLHDMGYVYWK